MKKCGPRRHGDHFLFWITVKEVVYLLVDVLYDRRCLIAHLNGEPTTHLRKHFLFYLLFHLLPLLDVLMSHKQGSHCGSHSMPIHFSDVVYSGCCRVRFFTVCH